MFHIGKILALAALALLLCSCSTLPNGPGDYRPSRLGQIRDAAVNAAIRPATWIPAAGAAVFSMGDLDERVSDWAIEHTYIFGSNEDASVASNELRALSCASTGLTLLAMRPSLPAPAGFTTTQSDSSPGMRTRTFFSTATALGLNSAIVGSLKESVGRTRPNGENEESFPSSHTAQAFACANLASRNLDAVAVSDETKLAMRISFYTMAVGTGWARIEGLHHYPSDTLAGAALSSFLSHFLYNLVVGPMGAAGGGGPGDETDFSVEILDDGLWMRLRWDF